MAFSPLQTVIVIAIISGLTGVWWWQLQASIKMRFDAIKDAFVIFEKKVVAHEASQAGLAESIRREMQDEAVTHEKITGDLRNLRSLTEQQYANIIELLGRLERAVSEAAIVSTRLRRDADRLEHVQATSLEKIEVLDKQIKALEDIVSRSAPDDPQRAGLRSKKGADGP